MHRVRVSIGAYGEWLKIRDEDDLPDPFIGAAASGPKRPRRTSGGGRRMGKGAQRQALPRKR
jgi:hypothetical protein